MIRKILVLAGAIALHACGGLTPCPAAETDSVPATEWAYQTLAAADMFTTLDIRQHAGYREQNPILGSHPADARIVGYFAISGLAHYGITRWLVNSGTPNRVVQAWEASGITVEAYCVGHNYALGLRMAL